MQNYGIMNYLIVWKDEHTPYILSCTENFLDITLTATIIDEFEKISTTFNYKSNEFTKFTFHKNNKTFGWLIVSKDQNSKLSLIEYKSINDLIGVIGEILIENERLYDIKQEALKIESLSYDEYISYEYLNMVQNFHKDFSFFLHDNVLQNILALKKLTESIETDHIETKKLILESFDTLNEVFRNKISELYPSTIENAPLSRSIQFLCDKLNDKQDAVFINFNCSHDLQLEKEIKFHIYRIIQELIVNALKHSHATEIIITLIQTEFSIESVIQDNGIGFDHNEIRLRGFENHHFGLLSINQEVNSLNGKMTVLPVIPHGTKFTIVLPITMEERRL
ncbi:sensor histidine kinase [Vagococcus allomyrinae]|nr:ATP-binding protein [Vagococcus allomyrinae]